VFVHCPGDQAGLVLMADENGKVLSGLRLADGVEVEVVAWRPRVAGDAHYRVRTASTGIDGWLPGENLRSTAEPLPAAARSAPPTATVPETSGRRLGHPSPSSAPAARTAPSAPSAVEDSGGRRFGQRVAPGCAPAPPPAEPDPIDVRGRRFGQRS
jgi:hypothetical protein